MKNKKRILLIVILLLLLAVLLIGFTYSKYVEKVTIGAKGMVAKWNFTGEIESSTTNLISLSDTLDESTSNKLAPGTTGSFSIVVDATGSDVDIDYAVNYVSETNKPDNLYFYLNNDKTHKYYTLRELMKGINNSNISTLEGTICTTDNPQKKVYDVSWEWPYETYDGDSHADKKDLEYAKAGKEYSFNLEITGTQKMQDSN